MPYKGWENLVFQSSSGDIDTVFLLGKNTRTTDRGEWKMSSNSQYLELYCVYTNHDSTRVPTEKRTLGFFMSIDAISKGQGELFVMLLAKNAWFHPVVTSVESLNKMQPIQYSTSFAKYNDVYIFEPDATDSLKFYEDYNYVTRLYWSKSEGVIRYEGKHGEYWELKRKFIPGKRRYVEYMKLIP